MQNEQQPVNTNAFGAVEESKGQPAGVAIDDQTHPLRLLVLADEYASFYTLQSENSLVMDMSLPRYHMAKIARFAPLCGKQAAIVNELGIHFVSMESKQEQLFVAQANIDSLRYSPADNFVVTCEKFNVNTPDYPNLKIMDATTGSTLAQFIWRKPAKEGQKTLMWSPTRASSSAWRLQPPTTSLTASKSTAITISRNLRRKFSPNSLAKVPTRKTRPS